MDRDKIPRLAGLPNIEPNAVIFGVDANALSDLKKVKLDKEMEFEST